MIEEEYVIKKNIKLNLFLQTLPTINKYLIKKNQIFKGKDSHFKDAIRSIKSINKNKEVDYKEAFFIMFSLSIDFVEIKNKVLKKELNFEYITEESFWENKEIDINASIFFSYTFLNELYKTELAIDFKKLENIENIEEYINIREEVIKKS